MGRNKEEEEEENTKLRTPLKKISLCIVLAIIIMLLIIVIVLVLHFHHHHHGSNAVNTNCDFFHGKWVYDESYPMYDSAVCPFIEKEFNCLRNGRPDRRYLKYRWQPLGCDLASFDGQDLLEKYKGKNILFSGDSLTRDQYMSFVCLLYTSVPGINYNMSRVGLISTFLLPDYGIKVVLDRNVFLVDLVPTKVGMVLKLDSVAQSEPLWLNNDMLVFNTLHWWSYRGAQQPWKYIQIGETILKDMDRMVALETGLNTWANWVDKNVDPSKTIVFFQGASPSHYHGSEWNEPSMTNCAGLMEPLLGSSYPGGSPPALAVQKKVVSSMSVPVKFLDITLLSQLRVDAHPSHYGAGVAGTSCNFFKGSWVLDSSYPLYNSTTCPFVQKEFNCFKNGRPDQIYLHYRWQPLDCQLSRFDGRGFLQKFKGKSIMFVGDSLSRNMWQSLICLLYTSLEGRTKVNETIVGGDLSIFTFHEFGVKIMLERNVYLVDVVMEKTGRILELDSIESGKLWKGVDVVIFNTWHWWSRRGEGQPWDYIRVGNQTFKDMNRLTAFELALHTWAKWVDDNIDPAKTTVFFQGISPSHYNGSDWHDPSAKTCLGERQPIKGTTYPVLLIICLHQSSNAILVEHFLSPKDQSSQSFIGCDIFNGRWNYDDTYPLYHASSCPFIEKSFDCEGNGRPDHQYLKYRWKPNGCDLPKFSGLNFLKMFKGKKILFVGDSLSLNQWQSLTCMLHAALPQSKFTTQKKGDLSTLTFPEYEVSLMLSRNAFLVDLVQEKKGRVLKLNSIQNGDAWIGYDMLIFNTWHWWLHKGRLKSWDYIQDGNKLYRDMDRLVAFGKGLRTWAKWVDSNINSSKTQVFFQGISPTHYNGKEWNPSTAKSCIGETQPIMDSSYPGGSLPAVGVVKGMLANMSTPVTLLDITTLSQLRKDGHPSLYDSADANHQGNDCSHWCLAGVPDTWNEILYGILVANNQTM
ncbi:OLC1v1023315C1 [Oldenlandia corymbosa var. corymbosa]|uniref:OLC1v1023315C1 n=1 Tax=Oldenlandia corymbosa var. corymbosa TaxID=529605 RepID=A0AAV1C0D6_OLDCO|nr:OLC1v1023315C1 [Oldenlandia corymbosa var. corymbosa]